MKKITVLYFSGILLAVVLVVFIYSQVLDTTTTAATPRVEHSSVKTDQKAIISFKIYNDGDRDLNYTYTISLNDEKHSKENPVLVKPGKKFMYSMEILSSKLGEGKANVLIYRGAGEGKTLIDNKTYYLK